MEPTANNNNNYEVHYNILRARIQGNVPLNFYRFCGSLHVSYQAITKLSFPNLNLSLSMTNLWPTTSYRMYL